MKSVEEQIQDAVLSRLKAFTGTYGADSLEEALRAKAALLVPHLVNQQFEKFVTAYMTAAVKGGLEKVLG